MLSLYSRGLTTDEIAAQLHLEVTNIVFKDGLIVSKVAPYDGHLTNVSAFGRKDLEDVVYASVCS